MKPPRALLFVRFPGTKSVVAAASITVAFACLSVAMVSRTRAAAQTTTSACTPGTLVTIDSGPVCGLTANGVTSYLGVPFAAPPVGARRWQAPAPVSPWTATLQATAAGPNCPQPPYPPGAPPSAAMNEDCLTLNIHVPMNAGPALPVMVEIHGGGFVIGTPPNGAHVAEAGRVIMVAIHYRLGILGFLVDRPLGEHSGDYGLLDQQAALRWVQRNIARFGGDPRNVTLFGESAGGLSVLSQIASPQARGLFERAIVESGSYNLTQAPLASAEAAGEAFAAKAGCASQTAACLRILPVSIILADQNAAGYTPNINSEVLPESLGAAFATGNFSRVPIINGTNRDEWRLFVALSELEGNPVTASNYQSMISSTLGVPPVVAAIIAAEYPLTAFPSPSIALGAVGTDAIFACPALSIDQSVSRFVPTFAYEFNDENAPENFLPPVSFPYGAAHASELQYLFGLPTAAFPGTLSAQQQQLAAIMKAYWTDFAELGFPSSSGTPFWPPFNNLTQKMQSLAPPAPQTETNFASTHNCAFWTALEAA